MPRKSSSKWTTETWVAEAKKKHGKTIDYSNTVFVNSKTRVLLRCKVHNHRFEQIPSTHLRAIHPCPICARKSRIKKQRLTKSEFIKRARQIHGNRFSYNKFEYVNSQTKSTITCKKHGDFEQSPTNHLAAKIGCRECSKENRKPIYNGRNAEFRVINTETFIKKARLKYGYKFDYSKSRFKGKRNPITIGCRKHGFVKTTPQYHLYTNGCPECTKEQKIKKLRKTKTDFVKRAKKKFGAKTYDYSQFNYVTANVKGKIICKIHGAFAQSPSAHLASQGCPSCVRERQAKSRLNNTDYILKRFLSVHGDQYDYSAVRYEGVEKKVKIMCHKHGVFEMTPKSHIVGQGCPKCASSLGEKIIGDFLKDAGIKFEHQYKIQSSDQRLKRFDFFVPKLKLAIEYDGRQHFEPVNFGGMSDIRAREEHLKQVERDLDKNEWAAKNGITLFRIPFEDRDDGMLDRLEEVIVHLMQNKNPEELKFWY